MVSALCNVKRVPEKRCEHCATREDSFADKAWLALIFMMAAKHLISIFTSM